MDYTSLFRNTSDAQAYAAGDRVFAVGDEGSCMYIVLNGSVEVRAGGAVVEVLGPGGLFGEMSLIDAAPRSAAVYARSDCHLVPIDHQRFQFLVQQTPDFALRVMAVMAQRLRRQTDP